MRIIVMEKILKTFGLEQTSKNIQNVYKVGDMILEDATDSFIYETAIKRGLVKEPKCEVCGRKLERLYTLNGVLDSEDCPKVDYFLGGHEKSFLDKFKIKF
jgi:hypothetical protein